LVIFELHNIGKLLIPQMVKFRFISLPVLPMPRDSAFQSTCINPVVSNRLIETQVCDNFWEVIDQFSHVGNVSFFLDQIAKHGETSL
jgi:hypothetical protein